MTAQEASLQALLPTLLARVKRTGCQVLMELEAIKCCNIMSFKKVTCHLTAGATSTLVSDRLCQRGDGRRRHYDTMSIKGKHAFSN